MSIDRLRPTVGDEDVDRLKKLASEVVTALRGRTVFNINSTMAGGGVAEMMQSLLCYVRGSGIDARWLVIEGDPEFFAITKRIHNGIHGSPGDNGDLGEDEHTHFAAVSSDNIHELMSQVRSGDIVVLHDPQTAGLVDGLREIGATVIWRSHIGGQMTNAHTLRSWAFLRRYIESADAYVFTRPDYVPSWIEPDCVVIIQPSIDPLSAKNNDMTDDQVRAIIAHVGLAAPRAVSGPAVTFTRHDGTPGRVNRFADILQTGPTPYFSTPLVVQVSRWDELKDMSGVMRGFTRYVPRSTMAHLLLVGPIVTGVSDDPEGGEVYDQCVDEWRTLPHHDRSRVTLACLPMADHEENAAIVNAIQRHADIVVQKSLAEGFGLTVAEAMWKGKPVVASAVGGIVDQIEDGISGILIREPTDLEEFGNALTMILSDSSLARELGMNARERVRENFLGTRHLSQYAQLLLKISNSNNAVA